MMKSASYTGCVLKARNPNNPILSAAQCGVTVVPRADSVLKARNTRMGSHHPTLRPDGLSVGLLG